MKWLASALLVVVVLLQYRIWLSEDGVRELRHLESAVATQRTENDQLGERNSAAQFVEKAWRECHF